MANPHGFTVATMPDANASAERSVDHEPTPSSSASSVRSSSAVSSPVLPVHHLAVGVEEDGGREPDPPEGGDHRGVLVLGGRVGDAGAVDEGEGVVGAVGDGQAEEGDLVAADLLVHLLERGHLGDARHARGREEVHDRGGAPHARERHLLAVEGGVGGLVEGRHLVLGDEGDGGRGTRVVRVVGVVGEEHHGGSGGEQGEHASRRRAVATAAGGTRTRRDGNAVTCERHTSERRPRVGRGSVVDDPHDGGTSVRSGGRCPGPPEAVTSPPGAAMPQPRRVIRFRRSCRPPGPGGAPGSGSPAAGPRGGPPSAADRDDACPGAPCR